MAKKKRCRSNAHLIRLRKKQKKRREPQISIPIIIKEMIKGLARINQILRYILQIDPTFLERLINLLKSLLEK